MQFRHSWVLPALALIAGSAASGARGQVQTPPVPVSPDLIVHEWGTFLAMGGSDGVALDGMYHEEHALPSFVHARGRDQLRLYNIMTKGETPVIYFYTPTAQHVRVEVGFPKGLWTQWYPQVAGAWPKYGTMPAADALQGGKIVWHANIIPADAKLAPSLPATSADALWNFARQVDAAFVQTYDPRKPPGPGSMETERYLFYRGLGTSSLPVRFSYDSGGTIASDPDRKVSVRHVFVVRVEGGKAAYAYRPELKPGDDATGVIPSLERARPVGEVADALADDLARRLEESGLYAKEARAMVNTWKSSYFKTEGVRALFVLPQSWTDGFIPMALNPRPKELVRVMVGRLELLTPDRERMAEAAVADLASSDSGRRMAAFETLQKQGRYVEPIIRRVLKTSKDEKVKLLCRKLLKAEFVTELRSAVRSLPDPEAPKIGADWVGPANGLQAQIQPNPMAMMVPTEDREQLRAQLSSLLRSVGLDEEAKAEGTRALACLKKATILPETCGEGSALRLEARSFEGIGDDRQALAKYGRLIDVTATAATRNDCRKCHANGGAVPPSLAEFRGWWAGEGYARSVEQLGRLDPASDGLKAIADKGSTPTPIGVKLRRAYLAEARGRLDEADALWAEIGGETAKLARKD